MPGLGNNQQLIPFLLSSYTQDSTAWESSYLHIVSSNLIPLYRVYIPNCSDEFLSIGQPRNILTRDGRVERVFPLAPEPIMELFQA
jgi:hypothetical protein